MEIELVGIDAVENAVETGVLEGVVDLLRDGGFGVEEVLVRSKGVFAIDGDEISGEFARGIRNDAHEGEIDGAELGGFDKGIVLGDDGVDGAGTEVDLFCEVVGFVVDAVDKTDNNDDSDDSDNAEDGETEDGAFENASGFFGRRSGAGRL